MNRYESPGTGRFITPDRGGLPSASDPGSWNKYAYVQGDPVNNADPSGRDTCPIDALLDDETPLSCGATISEVCSTFEDNPIALSDCAQQVEDDVQAVCQALTTAFQSGAPVAWNSSECGAPPTQNVAAQPTCKQVLTQEVQSFLQSQAPALLNWDSNLATQLVAVGSADGVDPRLMASIGALESGDGTIFAAANNPFGLLVRTALSASRVPPLPSLPKGEPSCT